MGRGGTYIEFVKIWVALTISDFATVSATARVCWGGSCDLNDGAGVEMCLADVDSESQATCVNCCRQKWMIDRFL
jgi:hypothetical protein